MRRAGVILRKCGEVFFRGESGPPAGAGIGGGSGIYSFKQIILMVVKIGRFSTKMRLLYNKDCYIVCAGSRDRWRKWAMQGEGCFSGRVGKQGKGNRE